MTLRNFQYYLTHAFDTNEQKSDNLIATIRLSLVKHFFSNWKLILSTNMLFYKITIFSKCSVSPKNACLYENVSNLLKEVCLRHLLLLQLMYVSKKPVLEEAFKTSFGQQNATPPLESISQQV